MIFNLFDPEQFHQDQIRIAADPHVAPDLSVIMIFILKQLSGLIHKIIIQGHQFLLRDILPWIVCQSLLNQRHETVIDHPYILPVHTFLDFTHALLLNRADP